MGSLVGSWVSEVGSLLDVSGPGVAVELLLMMSWLSATSELEEFCPPEVDFGSFSSDLAELSTLDEELELVLTELMLDSTELLLVSPTDCSPQPTRKTAAQNAKTPIIFLLCFIEFPP